MFWQSAQTKLASWPVTLQLFAMEYRLPLLDPAIAAPLATAAEIAGSVLIFFGLFARFGALILLGITATIQIFVYPQNWAEHLMWASLLLLILTRGAGVVSLDYIAGLADFAVENPELGRIWLFEILSCDNPHDDVFFKQFLESTEALANSEFSEEGIDAEALSVMILAGYFLWPVWVRARARSKKERQAMSLRMRREFLRLSLHGTLRAEEFPELQQLLEK